MNRRIYTAHRAHPDTPAVPQRVSLRLPRLDWLGQWIPDWVPDWVLVAMIVGACFGGVLLRWWLYS